MSQRNLCYVLLLAVVLSVGVVGCKKPQPEVEPVAPVEEAPTPPPAPPVEVKEEAPKPVKIEEIKEPGIDELNAQGVLSTVYFALDKSDLTDTSRAALRTNADWLNANPNYYVVIEGHCDERGSIEYNLALGERRANAARDFLATLGIDKSKLRIVSYGEEKPAVEGRNEAAWAKNRRAQFYIERKG